MGHVWRVGIIARFCCCCCYGGWVCLATAEEEASRWKNKHALDVRLYICAAFNLCEFEWFWFYVDVIFGDAATKDTVRWVSAGYRNPSATDGLVATLLWIAHILASLRPIDTRTRAHCVIVFVAPR